MLDNKDQVISLAISNICWDRNLDSEVAYQMSAAGVRGVEIAPTKIGPVLELTRGELASYKAFWNDRGIEIVAMQALLFGRADLLLFENSSTRESTLNYLKKIIDIGAALGAKALVFGSPKNRLRGNKSLAEVRPLALEFFGALGSYAASAGTCLVLEANPVEYGCDFLTKTDEAWQLVKEVNSPGFGLHLDIGGIVLNKEDPIKIVADYGAAARYFHISAPSLEPVHKQTGIDYAGILSALKRSGYSGWVSIEMKQQNGDPLELVAGALNFLTPIIKAL